MLDFAYFDGIRDASERLSLSLPGFCLYCVLALVQLKLFSMK